MVKVDVRRDYYADLGLAPSADAEDIKKQFRKLALKFHPDRNPGRELEFNAKFQAIQAANEILSDPTQRLMYDTDRLRAGYGKFYGPPKGPPQRKPAPANYPPPPPTAKQQQQSRKSGPGPRPGSFQNTAGSQRYASYARAAPHQSWQKAQDYGQTRADAFRGFQDMKGGAAGMSGWSNFDPKTGRGGAPRSEASQNARAKSAYQYFRAAQEAANAEAFNAQQQQSKKKKQGFTPHTPGGDEPMATNTSSYASTPRDRSQRWSSYFESAPSPTARKPTAPEASQAQFERTGSFAERASSRYATTGGEKTFFSSAWLGRSTSMREPPTSSRSPRGTASAEDSANAGRHRSTSPKSRSSRNRAFSPSTSSSDTETESEDDRPPFKPKVPKSRLRSHQKFAGFQTQQPGTGEHSSTRTSFGDDRHSSTPHDQFGELRSYFNTTRHLDTDRDYVKGHDFDSATSPRGSQRPFPFTNSNTTPNFAAEPNTGADSPNAAFKSSSHGDLRDRFNAEDWRDAFRGDFAFTPSPSKDQTRPSQRDRNAKRSGFFSAPQSGTPSEAGHESSGSTPASQQMPTPFASTEFKADDWVEQFKNMSWAMPANDGSQADSNPQPSRSPRKQPRTMAKARSDPRTASVATEAEEAASTVGGGNESHSPKPGADGGEAMDIDEDDSINQPPAATTPEQKPKDQSGSTSQKAASSSAGNKRESSTFNLNKLGKTDPFTSTNNGGIDNLQDIGTTLPFESRAKTAKPTVHDIRPRQLDCPNPPKRPRPPSLLPISAGSQQMALSRSAWNRYVAEMNAYMREWNAFNGRMLEHFNARQYAVKTGLAPGWISAVGDSSKLHLDSQNGPEDSGLLETDDEGIDDLVPDSAKGGYSAYLRGLEEDVKVRKHWDVACEMHQECILELGQIRGWIRNGGKII